jgi:hypothetical protein
VDRVIRFTISSGIVGGCLNYALFNGILPMLLPGNSLRTILAKVAFNNTIAKMMSAFAVISTSALLQGRTIDYIIRKLKADLTTSMGLALAFWGPTQTLMFLYVPEDYHTEIISTLGIIYSAMYSHVVHREISREASDHDTATGPPTHVTSGAAASTERPSAKKTPMRLYTGSRA